MEKFLLEKALTIGISEIFNSDQGSQFTSLSFIELLQKKNIQVSMDGRGRAIDNVFTEKLWRSVKYEEVYISNYQTVREAEEGINNYMTFYNQERPRQSLDYETSGEVYFVNNNQERRPSCNLNMAN